MEALQVCPEEEVPDASLMAHHVALGRVVSLCVDVLRHTQVHERRRVHAEVLGYQVAS